MRITSSSGPLSRVGAPVFVALAGDGNNGGSQLQEWSSLIGIVTAIIGNILISFALNTQRYAHLRIAREYNDAHTPLKNRRQKRRPRSGYGALDQQERIAEERLEANLTSSNGTYTSSAQPDGAVGRISEAEETDPILDSDDALEKNGDDEQKSYLKSPYWWAGITMMTVGEAGNFIAYGFAPASIVSPLGVVALVSNCVIAPFMLKERFRKRDGVGVLIAIAGAVVVVLSARQGEDKLGPDNLWDAIKRWEFLLYLAITAVFVIGLMWASGKYGQKSILIDLGLVALFGGYTALSTKGVASLLSYTLFRALTFPITYVLVLVLVVSALMQIHYVNKALQRFDSTQVIPTQFVLFTISVIVGSTVLYRDFESATGDQLGKFITGCVMTFVGVYLITSGRKDEGDDYDSVLSSDEEEQIGLIDEDAEQAEGLMHGAFSQSISSRMDANVMASDSTEGGRRRRSSARRSNLRTPPERPARIPSSTPSIAVTPDSGFGDGPSPFTDLADRMPSWDESTPRPSVSRDSHHQSTQSASRIENFARQANHTSSGTTSTPSLVRLPTAPSDPTTPPASAKGSSPPKAESGSQSRPDLSGTPIADNPPSTTPLRSTRHSISRLIPGPLISPLSSSLSAVVADSILRGEGTQSRRGSLRRDRLSHRSQQGLAEGEAERSPLASRTTTNASMDERGHQSTNSLDVPSSDLTGTIGDEHNKKSRFRSMSESLTGLMGKKQRKNGRDRDVDETDDRGGDQA